MTSANKPRTSRRRRVDLHNNWHRVGIIGTVAGVAIAAYAVFGPVGDTTAERSNTNFRIEELVGEMPRCSTIEGTASHEEGKVLWLAHQSSTDGPYYYKQRLTHDTNSGRWRTERTVGDGKGGETFHFKLFQLDTETSDFVESITVVPDIGEGAHYHTDTLPPGADVKDEMTTLSAADPEPCT
jgi:hypothetical protein